MIIVSGALRSARTAVSSLSGAIRRRVLLVRLSLHDPPTDTWGRPVGRTVAVRGPTARRGLAALAGAPRSSPEGSSCTSRSLGGPRRPHSREVVSHGALTVSAVLAFLGLAIGNTAVCAAGGILLMTIYPVLLRLAGRGPRKDSSSAGDDRFGG